MNHKAIHLIAFFVVVALALAGCLSKGQNSNLDAGAEDAPIPDLAMSTQINILEHVISVHHLSVPSSGDWQEDANSLEDGEYRFHSGNWKMIIRFALDNEGAQQAIIIDSENNTFWCGSVEPDGDIVDTCLVR